MLIAGRHKNDRILMSTTQQPYSGVVLTAATTDGTRQTLSEVDTDAVLDLLSDEYARQVLEALCDRPAAAPTLAESMAASRATVYRRLNDLEAAGLVEATVAVDPDGHHRKRYHLVVDGLQLRFGGSGIEIDSGE